MRIGCLVSGITHRHPAVLANMATALDNISGGRAILGIGAAWNALEHNAYGLDLGTPGERSTRFAEAAKIIRKLVDGERVTQSGRYYDLTNAEVLVRPVQKRLPILIGGGGEQRTLRTTARYADMWHGFGTTEQIAHKLAVLGKHCVEVGRDRNEIMPFAGKWVVIREDPAEAQRVRERGPEQIAQSIAAYWKIGVKGFIVAFAEPFDVESIERLATEVRPRLEALTSETPAAVSR